jgi:4-amino-4-deoxy-L-arabinose transferase-like glycosyltransferase
MFGEHIWLLRALLFLVGLITVAGMWKLGKEIFSNPDAAFIAGWTFCFSPLFYYYSINPLPDLLALCFAVWGLVWFFRWNKTQNHRALLVCTALFALATLCKLPYIIFYAVFGGWLVNVLKSRPVSWRNVFGVIAITGVSVAAALSWYAVVMKEWSPNKVTSGIFGEDFSAGDFIETITGSIISTLPELLLNYAAVPLFVIGLYFFFAGKKKQNPHVLPLIMLSIAVLLYYIFELNAITLIHDYYLLPFLPLLFLVVTYGAIQFSAKGNWQRIAVWIFVLATPLTAFLRIDSRWNEQDPGFNPDLITYQNQLRSATPADAKIVIGNDESAHISLYYTQHFGWNFHSDQLRVDEIETMISKGATYLYSDSYIIESDSQLQRFFGDTIATIGSFRIIELKSMVLSP